MKILILAIFIMFAGIASGELNCNYDSNSFVTTTQDIEWSCWTYDFDDMRCYSAVYYENDLLSVFPERKYVEGIGMIDYFTSRDGLVSVYFKTKDLYEGYNYTFKVICGQINGSSILSYSKNVTVYNRNADEVIYRGIWLKSNIGYIFGIGILLLVGVLIIWLITR